MLKAIAMAALMALPMIGVGATQATAGDRVVLIELYTSQGCSSCPPADALLKELASRDDVIPLALHVDYWDYIGWKDEFADPAYADRQRAYAHAAGQRTIYTPQMIVGGKDHVVGYKPMRLAELIEKHSNGAEAAQIKLDRTGGSVKVRVNAARDIGPTIVQLVRYMPEATVAIGRGENAGKTISYANIVTEWRVLGKWDGYSPYAVEAPAHGNEPIVIVLQKPNNGPVLAAARLR